MRKSLLVNDKDIIVDGVDVKRVCNVLSTISKERFGSKAPLLSEWQEIVSVALGYANYHNLHKEAKSAAEALKPEITPYDRMIETFKDSLEKNAAWVKDICPKKLLERRSLRWCELALMITTQEYGIWRVYPQSSHITLVVGKDSDQVLKAISNAYKEQKYYRLSEDCTLQDVKVDVVKQIEEHQALLEQHAENDKRILSLKPRPSAAYHCIAGYAEKGIDDKAIRELVGVSELHHNLSLAININRADLLKFTAPSMTDPHFHYLTIVDLDLIDSGKPGEYVQSTYSFWVDESLRHNARSMSII